MVKSSLAVAAALSVVTLGACSPHQDASTATSSSTPAPNAQTLVAHLHTAHNQPVATATFEFGNGYATVTVKTTQNNVLEAGFHAMHIHAVGKCDANSVGAQGGPPGDFLSAGPHYQAPGHTGEPMSGDLDPLEVRRDGAALLVTTTDAFTRDDLLAGNKTALMLHGAEHSPDAEKRFACGVIGTS